MKLSRYIFGVFAIFLFTLFALANDELVAVNFLPEFLSAGTVSSVYLPIYLLTALVLFIGVIIGVFIEYFRNFKRRKEFNENTKKLLKIEEELKKKKAEFLTEEEKIFDLLD